MKVQRFNKYAEIPGSNLFLDRIPVFATQNYADYLKEVKGHDTIWLVKLENNTVSFLIPFVIIKKLIFSKGYFLTDIISFDSDYTLEKENEFIEDVVLYIKKNKLCDWIQQGPNWALFNTFPAGAKAVKFGTYKIFLKKNREEELLKKMNRYHRKDINYAIRTKVEIKKGNEYLNSCLSIIKETAKEAGLSAPSSTDIEKLITFFKDDLKIYVSYFDNIAQTAAIFIRSKYCTYGLYAGSITGALRGSNVYLFWEAIKDGMVNNCDCFDFVGGRINPLPGSKLERIQRFKEHFGSEFIQGYLWKMNFSAIKYYLYQIPVSMILLAMNKKYKPDIIDQEIKRMK